MDSRGQMEDNATLAVIKIGLPMIIHAIIYAATFPYTFQVYWRKFLQLQAAWNLLK